MSEALGHWPLTVPDAARDAAARWPHAPALIEGDRQWSFSELWADALACASACRQLGVRAGDRVAIWAPNGRAWILAALGAHCLGAAIVPLNTRFKGKEAADLLRRAEVSTLFAAREFLGVDYLSLIAEEPLPALQRRLLVEDIEVLLDRGRAAHAAPLPFAQADDVSDIIFTSGTTGAPKGVMTTHRQVTQIFGDWARRVDLREGDRYLVVNPFFHTFGYKAGWVACLLLGATIVPQPTFDVAETVRQIELNRISFLPGPPTIYQSLLAELANGAHRDFSSLRVAVTGAAPVPPALVTRMRDELGMQNVVNGYGMTECGVITMTRQGDDPETVANSCGYPMPGMEIRCVDDAGGDVALSEAGEILVRSHAVMRGYLDDARATAETIDAEGWLHTGDIGALDARGYLRITDRKKDMFISGGFNCYPAEIENLLSAHPAIETAAVVGVPDERLGEVGKAYVVLRPGMSAEAREIIGWARGAMANYKVPRQIEFVAALPRNAGGKVLRMELRDRAPI
jgi:acyl-CoA synthetase (AMP-forming)/AMP-acid ligase II